MEVIVPAFETVEKLLRVDKRKNGAGVHLSLYCMEVPCEEGSLLYNTLTGELLLVSEGEIDRYCEIFFHKHFLVYDSEDEFGLASQFRYLHQVMRLQEKGFSNFLIFPTTDCNARCFYCYELGRKRISMTETTALDTASFIARNSNGKNVKLLWFGGEPLYNVKPIDIIIRELQKNGISFISQMVSNAFLFDDALVKKAVSDWKLNQIQIPLDGTEEIYNKRKAYIYKEVNAFQRVLDNIDLLLNAGVTVALRLNVDKDNIYVMDDLVNLLVSRFSGDEKLQVYVTLIKNFQTNIIDSKESEKVHMLRQQLIDAGIGLVSVLRESPIVNQCMADNDNCITILPDGSLGKCDSLTETGFVGSIYDEKEIVPEKWEEWKELMSVPECKTCFYYPQCYRLKNCIWLEGICNAYNRDSIKSMLEQKIVNTYREKRGYIRCKPGINQLC